MPTKTVPRRTEPFARQNVVKSGIIYTLDGRVAGKGNLNNVKNLGRGIYILNGTKVVVK